MTAHDPRVEALRTSLWATWGRARQTTDWPSMGQLAEALAAADAVGEGEPNPDDRSGDVRSNNVEEFLAELGSPGADAVEDRPGEWWTLRWNSLSGWNVVGIEPVGADWDSRPEVVLAPLSGGGVEPSRSRQGEVEVVGLVEDDRPRHPFVPGVTPVDQITPARTRSVEPSREDRLSFDAMQGMNDTALIAYRSLEAEATRLRAENRHLRKSIENSDRDHWFAACADLTAALREAESALRDLSEGEISDYPIEQHHIEEIAGPVLDKIDAALAAAGEPDEDRDYRDEAVMNVDARLGYTAEQAASPAAHRALYDDEETRLRSGSRLPEQDTSEAEA